MLLTAELQEWSCYLERTRTHEAGMARSAEVVKSYLVVVGLVWFAVVRCLSGVLKHR